MRRKMSVLMTLGKALAEALFLYALTARLWKPCCTINLEATDSSSIGKRWPWETFRVERASRRLAYSHTTWKYQISV